MFPALKSNAAAGYKGLNKGPVKIELLKGAGHRQAAVPCRLVELRWSGKIEVNLNGKGTPKDPEGRIAIILLKLTEISSRFC